MSVARNRATDVLRRRASGAAKLREVAVNSRDEYVERAGPDDIDEAAVSGVPGRSAPVDLHVLPPGACRLTRRWR